MIKRIEFIHALNPTASSEPLRFSPQDRLEWCSSTSPGLDCPDALGLSKRGHRNHEHGEDR